MTLKDMLTTLHTTGERVELRDSSNGELMTCSVSSPAIEPYEHETVLSWFPHAAPHKDCTFTVILDYSIWGE